MVAELQAFWTRASSRLGKHLSLWLLASSQKDSVEVEIEYRSVEVEVEINFFFFIIFFIKS